MSDNSNVYHADFKRGRGRPPGSKNKKGKKATLVSPLVFYYMRGDGYGDAAEQEELRRMIALDRNLDWNRIFISCKSWRPDLHPVVDEVTPVHNSGGTIAYLEIRYHDDEKLKKFFLAIRCEDTTLVNDSDTGKYCPSLSDRWDMLYAPDEIEGGERPDMMLPLGADRLRKACETHGPKSVALILCEGRHAMEGVQRRLADPDAQDIVEAFKEQHGVKEIVVCAWLSGFPGAQQTNFSLCPNSRFWETLPGERSDPVGLAQNNWTLDFKSGDSPLNCVVIVPDYDRDGMMEAEEVARRLHEVYGLFSGSLFVVSRVKDYRAVKRTWDDADDLPPDVSNIERVAQILNPKVWVRQEYIRDDKNRRILNKTNLCILLRSNPSIAQALAYDDFLHAPVLLGPLDLDETANDLQRRSSEDTYPRCVNDDVIQDLTTYAQWQPDFEKAAPVMMQDAMRDAARRHFINPVRDWLESLEWDGVARVDTVLVDYLGAEDTPYVRHCGKVLMLSMAKRIAQPGEQHDESLVLIGPQGFFKSTFCRRLVPKIDYYSNCLPKIGGNASAMKDARLHLHGKIVVEIDEAASIAKAEAEELKNFLSTAIDIFRAPFDRSDGAHKRHCVFIITTNDDELLKDPTGARRFLPVDIGTVRRPTSEDMDRLVVNREQLFAEAYHRTMTPSEKWPQGEPAYTTFAEEAMCREHQKEHTQTPRWEAQLEDVLSRVWELEGVALWPKEMRDYLHSDDFRPYAKGLPISDRCYARVLKRHGWTSEPRWLEACGPDGKPEAQKHRVWAKASTTGTIKKELRWETAGQRWRIKPTMERLRTALDVDIDKGDLAAE